MRSIVRTGLVVLFMFGSLAAEKDFSQITKFGKITDAQWKQIAPADYPEANTLVLFDKGAMKIESARSEFIEIAYQCRMKIITPVGADDIGEQVIRFHRKYDKIKNFKAHTITPDGKKYKLKKDAIFEREVGENYREKVFTFPNLQEGCIVEYQYKLLTKRWRHLKPWYFQTDIYTLESVFSVCLPNGFTYNVSSQNVPVIYRKPVVEEQHDINNSSPGAKLMTYTWTVKNQPPINDEPYMSSEDDYRSSLRFQLATFEDRYNYIKFVESWEKTGEDADKILANYRNKKKDVKKLAEKITAGLTTPTEKSKALYQYVINEFKTVNEYKNWYFYHDKMSGLLEEMSETPEGKNVLLCDLHAAVGIDAFPIMIRPRKSGRINIEDPNLAQFNYIIAYVEFEKSYVLLDATSKMYKYGLLPPNYLVGGGLLLDGKASQLVTLSVLPAESHRTDVTRIYIDAEGAAVCSTECRFTGYYATAFARIYEKSKPDEFVNDYFMDRLDSECTLGDYECGADSLGRFVVSMDFSSDDMITTLDNNLIVPTVHFAYRSNPFKSEKRFFPVDFQYPRSYLTVVAIYPEAGVQMFTPPEDLSFEIPGASFIRESTVTDSVVILKSIMTISQPEFKPASYKALRDFFEKVALNYQDETIVTLLE